ncbi:HNH endonuclease [Aquihabitans sp. McL0605]|uniref:HNH endonuclease signature motif containing protein n=1 Tax=Aquihabitans sp. McL0605 TaxID=3415671 RepID=UPI003CFB8177
MPSPSTLRADSLRVARLLDPSTMTGDQAAAVVADLAIAEKACATGRMFAAVRVAETDAWRGRGHQSAADWLAAETRISVRDAHAQLGTARRARNLPKTKKAMDHGELSPDQAAAVTDGATADPGVEDDLLDAAANDTHAALRDKAAKAKAAATDTAERERQIRRNRTRRLRLGGDGTGTLWISGPAVDLAKLHAILRPFEERRFRTGRTAGTRHLRQPPVRRLLRHAQPPHRHHLQHHHRRRRVRPAHPTSAGCSGASGPAERRTRHYARSRLGTGQPSRTSPSLSAHPSRQGARWEQRQGHRQHRPHRPRPRPHDRRRDLPRGRRRPHPRHRRQSAHARRLPRRRHHQGRDVVNVAHLGRHLNAHQRTAIEAMGLHCTNIACNRTIALEIDHRHPYAQDPITKLDNQEPHCPECHRNKTHHGWHLEAGTGRRRFLPPGHPDNPLTPKPPAPDPTRPTDRPWLAGRDLTDPHLELTDAQADTIERRLRRRVGLDQPDPVLMSPNRGGR